MSGAEFFRAPRLVACVVAAQLLGGVIGLTWGGRFMHAWVGGVLATIPGFLAGVVWQRRAKGPPVPAKTLAFGLALGLVLVAMAVGVVIPRLLRERNEIATLARLDVADLRRMEIQELVPSASPRLLTDVEALGAFARACGDVELYVPNHPAYERKWYVVLGGPKPRELELYLRSSDPSRVFGAFVERQGSTTWYHGSFQSLALRAWVARHLEAPR